MLNILTWSYGRHLYGDINVRNNIEIITSGVHAIDETHKYLCSIWYEAGVFLRAFTNINSHNPYSDSMRWVWGLGRSILQVNCGEQGWGQ